MVFPASNPYFPSSGQAKGDSETASDPGSMGSIDEEKHVDLDRDSGRFADD